MRRFDDVADCSCASSEARRLLARRLRQCKSHNVVETTSDQPGEVALYMLCDPRDVRTPRFRIPTLLQGSMPALCADSPGSTLAATTVCVNVGLNERGEVVRVDPLDDRSACHSGATQEQGDLC